MGKDVFKESVNIGTSKTAKKRLRIADGFIETNADDNEETKMVIDKLKKKMGQEAVKKQVNIDTSKRAKKRPRTVDGFIETNVDEESKLVVDKLQKKKPKLAEKLASKGNGYTDSDYDFDVMYGTDSEISLGSEVADSNDTYECESTDIDSSDMDEYEDDSTYEPTSDSEYGHENESASSGDTYDDFLHSRYYDDDCSHSSNDHEYKDECYDDLRIAHGTAVTYKIADERIKLFENDTESRILEIPKTDSDNDSCVELVPINMKRAKLLRQEKEKMILRENQLKEKKLLEEERRLAYEKSVQDYYDMDNFKKTSSFKSFKVSTVSVIKCPKNASQFSTDWMEIDDDSEFSAEDNDIVFPEVCVGKATVIPINDPTEMKSKRKQWLTNNIKTNGKTNECLTNGISGKPQLHKTIEEHSPSNSALDSKAKGGRQNSLPTPKEDRAHESTDFTQFFNSLNSRHVLLLLRGTLHFHGSLHIRLIAGKAMAFGYELQLNKTFTVHSPRGHGLICLTSSPDESSGESRAPCNLKAIDDLKEVFHSQDMESVKRAFNSATDAILLLERDRANRGVNMIERYMRETVFPNINAFNNESPYYSSEFILRCKFLHSPKNGLILNNEWLTLNLKSDSRLVAIGGKGVGKSTFVRYLINSNLAKFKRFLLIDLDIGQPELFLPQTLSVTEISDPILGPGYLQNVKPAKAVWLGDINVLPDPIKYWHCVEEIHKFCSSQPSYSSIPWVINTMGYSRGFGSELIACILKIFKPTNVVQIQSRTPTDNFDQIMKADVVNNFKFNVLRNEMVQIGGSCKYKTHIFNAARDKIHYKQVDMTAKDIRYTMILAKLGNCLKSNSDWLTSVKPFEASLDDLTVLITNGEEINSSDYLDLLNANLVYLCEKRPDNADDIIDCHGIGIIRGVYAPTNTLYLLSTIPLIELRRVNVLAIGTIPLPSAVFLNQHSRIHGTVPYVYNSDKFVGSKQVAQHIFRAGSRSTNTPIQLMEE